MKNNSCIGLQVKKILAQAMGQKRNSCKPKKKTSPFAQLFLSPMRGVSCHATLLTGRRLGCGDLTRHSREVRKIGSKRNMAVSLAILAFFSFAGATVPYKTAYFEQNLDHFNFVQDITFKQRYLYTGKSTAIRWSFHKAQLNQLSRLDLLHM